MNTQFDGFGAATFPICKPNVTQPIGKFLATMSVEEDTTSILTLETTHTRTPSTPTIRLMEEKILNEIRDELTRTKSPPPSDATTPKEEIAYEPDYKHHDISHPLLNFDRSVREMTIETPQVLDLSDSDKPTELFVQNCLKFFRREWKHITYKEKFEDSLLTGNVLFDTSQFSLLPRRTTVPPESLSNFLELVDVQAEQPVSERFYFHLNSQEMLSDFIKDKTFLETLKRCDPQPKAIFTISEPNPNIYILVVIEKVISGKIENFTLREKKWREMSGNPKHTQPFLWTFAPLFKMDEKDVILNDGMIPFKYLYPFSVNRQSELYSLIQYSKDSQIKKYSHVPGFFILEVNRFNNNSKEIKDKLNTLTTRRNSLVVKSTNIYEVIEMYQKMNLKSIEELKTQKTFNFLLPPQITEFSLGFQKVPFLNFVHELHLFPETANLLNIMLDSKNNLKARNFNVVLQCIFITKEEKRDFVVQKLPAKFNKKEMSATWYGTVSWQNATPVFNDQIKIKLPILVKPHHHVLFILHHLDLEKSRISKDGDLVFLGSVMVPLASVLSQQETAHVFPILKNIPSKEQGGIEWNAKTNIFKVRSKLVSTIYPQDEIVSSFFGTIADIMKLSSEQKKDIKYMKTLISNVTKSINDLKTLDIIKVVSHFPLLLNSLFSLLSFLPSYFSFVSETPTEQVKTPRNPVEAPNTERKMERKLSVKDRVKKLEDDVRDIIATPRKTERKLSFSPFGKRETKSTPNLPGEIKELTKTTSVPNKTITTLAPPPMSERYSLGKRISMKLFGDSPSTHPQLKHASSGFNFNLGFSKSTPVSPLETAMIKNELTFPERIQELEQNTFEYILHLLKKSRDVAKTVDVILPTMTSFVETQENSPTLTTLDKKPRHVLGSSYLEYMYSDDQTSYYYFTKYWLKVLEKPEEEKPLVEAPETARRRPSLFKPGLQTTVVVETKTDVKADSLEFAWFFFDLIIKSFALNKPKDEGKEYCKILRELIISYTNKIYFVLGKEISLRLNQELAKFFGRLFYEMKVEHVYEMINVYFETLDIRLKYDLTKQIPGKHQILYDILLLKMDFLKYHLDHDQIVPLSACNIEVSQDVKNVAYPAPRMILHVVDEMIQFERRAKHYLRNDGEIAQMSAQVFTRMASILKYIMTKVEVDGRYADRESREIIGKLYFPIIEYFLHIQYEIVLNHEFYEKLVIFILGCVGDTFLVKWVNENSPIKLLQLLASSLNKFTFDVTSPNELKKKQGKAMLETSHRLVSNLFIKFYQSFKTTILSCEIQPDTYSIQSTSYSDSEPNLLEISLYIVSLIVKKDTENSIGFCKSSKEFKEILTELVTTDKEGLYWYWIYGILLQGITLNIDDLDPFYHDLMLVMEKPVEIPEPSRVVFEIDTEDNIEIDKNNEIKYGTVDKLVERLFSLKQNKNYAKQFFLTYRSFMTPTDLLEQLKQRHFEQSHSEVQGLRIFNFLKNWISDYFYDFDRAMIVKVFNFLVLTKNSPAANGVKQKLEKNLLASEEKEKRRVFSVPPPPRILPLGHNNNRVSSSMEDFDLTIWDPIELCRQICLIEYKIFSRIQPNECFNLNWTKKNKEVTSPNIVALTNRFNAFSYWLATLICKEEDLTKRVLLVTNIIRMGQILAERFHNFNAVSTVTAALNNAAVFRLKKTFEALPKEMITKWDELNDLVSQTGNYKNLRSALQTSPPCIPYLGVFLTDLTFIEEGSSNIVKDMINFSKRRQFAEVLMRINVLQQSPYNFLETRELQQVLIECNDIWDDATLFKQSLKIEPREK